MNRAGRTSAAPQATDIEFASFDSPIGPLDVEFAGGGVRSIAFRNRAWTDDESSLARGGGQGAAYDASANRSPGLTELLRDLATYFRGDLEAIDRIPLTAGGSSFQRHVWEVLRTVRAGSTVSYLELAKRADVPSAVRAVAACNARNPVAIVVPCHRVIGSDGKLTGYGGGLARKCWLLDHEGATSSLWRAAR